MTQVSKISGNTKKVKITKIIHKKKIETNIFLILANKNKPKIIREIMIRPL